MLIRLSEEEMATKKALAEEIYQKAISGEDFDSLIAEYGEDPGMETYPNGYVFTYDQMAEEFEEANGKDNIVNSILSELVMDFIIDNAVITEAQ